MRKTIRTRFIAAGGVAAVLSLAAVTPALAGPSSGSGTRTVAAAPASQGDPRSTTTRVANFYGAYIDAIWDNEDAGSAADAKALRAFYLSPAAQKKVAAYEAEQHADGILFAQNVPVKWAVSYTGSGAGHSTALVTLTWSDGKDAQVTKVKVQSDLTTRKITDLAPVG
ncbi:hypothetical protein [Streptomyces sp. NPDC046939]|uniref:hypothetical protein n=1 Tax=Streptomyces sp. NPDC046939 TaxID=3155376 RepID=UPI0033FCF17A